MRLSISNRTGHFNWADPTQEQLVVTLHIYDADIEPVTLTFKPEWWYEREVPAQDRVYQASWLCQEWLDRIWISSSIPQVEAFREFLILHEKEITKGTVEYEIVSLENKVDALLNEIRKLKNYLEGQVEQEV
jgi:hypothetical protein